MEDDGVALRILGRVRPLLGEIALAGGQASFSLRPPAAPPGGGATPSRPAWLRAAVLPASPGHSKGKPGRTLREIVDWIEGIHSVEPLQGLLKGRKRIVMILAARHGGSPGSVQHWHIDRVGKTDLQAVRFYTSGLDLTLDHLPFWLEDDIPEHGTDLIAVEPYRTDLAPDLSPVLRSRLASITAQVGGLIVRILEEEGWEIGPRTPRGAKSPPRSRDARG